jgi:hypothetical protein
MSLGLFENDFFGSGWPERCALSVEILFFSKNCASSHIIRDARDAKEYSSVQESPAAADDDDDDDGGNHIMSPKQ